MFVFWVGGRTSLVFRLSGSPLTPYSSLHAERSLGGVIDPLGLRFSVPQLFDVKRTVVKLFMGDRSRGVIDNYLLISDNDLEPPFAAIVITELPEQMQNREQVFNAANILQSQLGGSVGITPSLKTISGPFGEAREMIVNNRVGTHCFPTSDFQLLPSDNDYSTIGLSRFVLFRGYLIEFSLVAVIPQGMQSDEAANFAGKAMDNLWASIASLD